MSNYKLALTVVAIAIGFSRSVAAQCPTIPEAVAKTRPRPFISSRISEMMVIPLEQAVRDADLIVIGSLTRPRVYLSEDKCTLYTDFLVTTRRMVVPNETEHLRPGQVDVVVRSWGGETAIDGVPVKIYDGNFRALSVGPAYLLLLRRDRPTGKYEIVDHGAYAIEVGADGRLKPILKDKGLIDVALDDRPLDEAISRILRLRKPR